MSPQDPNSSKNSTSLLPSPDQKTSPPKQATDSPCAPYQGPNLEVDLAPRKLPFFDRFGGRFLYISIIVHLVFGLLAAWFVVQRIHTKPPQEFKPVPVGPQTLTNTPQSNKHDVRHNAPQSPLPPVKPIVVVGPNPAKGPVTPIDVLPGTGPDSIPPMNGIPNPGDGPSTIIGPSRADNVKPTFFNPDGSTGALMGTFYDLKQTAEGKSTEMTPRKYAEELTAFIKRGWNPDRLNRFFKGPTPLYTNQIFIPDIAAEKGPTAFGLQDKVSPSMWIVLYKGTVSPPENGIFHFVGHGDDILMVRFNGKLVLAANWDNPAFGTVDTKWNPVGTYQYDWPTPNTPYPFRKGDALDLRAGTAYPIEILIGEQPGGRGHAVLMIEKEGVQYEKDGKGNPILPVFSMGPVKFLPLEKGESFPPHQANGPIWKSVKTIFNGTPLDIFNKK